MTSGTGPNVSRPNVGTGVRVSTRATVTLTWCVPFPFPTECWVEPYRGSVRTGNRPEVPKLGHRMDGPYRIPYDRGGRARSPAHPDSAVGLLRPDEPARVERIGGHVEIGRAHV